MFSIINRLKISSLNLCARLLLALIIVVIANLNFNNISALDFSRLAETDSPASDTSMVSEGTEAAAADVSTPKRKKPAPDENSPVTQVLESRHKKTRRYRPYSTDGDEALAAVAALDAAVRAAPAKYAVGSPARRLSQAKSCEIAAALGSPDRWVPGDGLVDATGQLKTDISPARLTRYHTRLTANSDRAKVLADIVTRDQELVADGIVPAGSPALVAGTAVSPHSYAVVPVEHVEERHVTPSVVGPILAVAKGGEMVVTPRDSRTRAAGKPATIFSPTKYPVVGGDRDARTRAILRDFKDPSSVIIGTDTSDARIIKELVHTPKGYMVAIAPKGVAGRLVKDTIFPVHVTHFTRAEARSGLKKPVYTDTHGKSIFLSVANARGIKTNLERAGRLACFKSASGSEICDLAPGIAWGTAKIANPRRGVLVEFPN